MRRLELLETLADAEELRKVRNQCRMMMTNHRQEITPSMQESWFLKVYQPQNPRHYCVWLLKEDNQVVGYFAAHKKEEGIYITEGISEDRRGQGLGSYLLQTLLEHPFLTGHSIYAEIFTSNLPSLKLHEKFGFISAVRKEEGSSEIRCLVKPVPNLAKSTY